MKNAILIADDDQSVCSIFGLLLQKAGYITVTAPAGLNDPRVRLAIVDIDMSLSAKFPTIYMVSSHYSRIPQVVKEGAFGVVYKPFDVEEILSVVGKAFAIL